MNFERILFASLAYRKCLVKIDAEDADKMKYDAKEINKIRENILDTLRHCYLDEFMNFLGGYRTYWTASDMELEILREQQERIEANMKMMGMGNSAEYFEVIKYLYYGYQIASWSSCENDGVPNPMVRAEGGESYIREIAEAVNSKLENSQDLKYEKSKINLENAKDHRISNILKCLDCQALSYNYNWLMSNGTISITGIWRLRKTMKNICRFHKLLLKEIERLSRYLELEESQATKFGRGLGIENNHPTIETWATLPLTSRLRGINLAIFD